ncbi:hypothetical protein [Streptomyces sp. NPDC093544]|jgi:hypothetical protein|uniref:hypothetical protein n=1 Tax=Streptomyces sp. NPDC093544 TaxID=3155200 RepID=UPI003426BD08
MSRDAGSQEQGTVQFAVHPVPSVDTLSEAQVRGGGCVWCGVTLDNRAAVDLGERTFDVQGVEARRWFPRGCLTCAGARFYRALLGHAGTCEQCADDQSQCETGTALRKAVRESRR